ncbi:MAG: glycosyltransferase 61 family protein [Pseudomonadota bacterium]
MQDEPQTDAPAFSAPAAAEQVVAFLSGLGRAARVLHFGAGPATLFLLGEGAHVTLIEDDAQAVEAVQAAAAQAGCGDRLVGPSEAQALDEARGFDAALISGQARGGVVQHALDLLADTAILVLTDAHLDGQWPVHHRLMAHDSTVYEGPVGQSTVWSLGPSPQSTVFADHVYVRAGQAAKEMIKPDRILVPKSYAGEKTITPTFTVLRPIDDLFELETRLQSLGMIPKRGTYGAPHIYDMQDVTVWIKEARKYFGRGGQVFVQHGQSFQRLDDPPELAQPVELPGLTLDLTAPGAGRYSFFLLDSLPKLFVGKEAGFDIRAFDTILVNTGANWLRATMQNLLGPDGPPLRFFNPKNPAFRLERSVHLEGVRQARFTPDWIHRYIDALFASDASGAAGHPDTFGKYVYISRQRAQGRRIVNHDAFAAMIARFGFTEVFAEDHAPQDLARRLAQAEILLSPHGAGLANLVFCPATARVIELFSSHFTSQYITLARDRGQPYEPFLCPDEEGLTVFDRYTDAPGSRAVYNRCDIVVPIDALEARLAALIG